MRRLTIFYILLTVALYFSFRKEGPSLDEMGESSPSVSPPRETLSTASSQTVLTPKMGEEPGAKISPSPSSRLDVIKEIHPMSIDREILSQDKVMAKFRTLAKKKVIKTSRELEELEELLDSETHRNKYFELLRNPSDDWEYYHLSQMRRIFAVEYMVQRLSSPHLKEQALEDIRELLLSDPFDKLANQEIKKAVAYEKVLMIQALKKIDPQYLQVLRNEFSETRFHRLLEYAIQETGQI